jgi:hypothetical protein
MSFADAVQTGAMLGWAPWVVQERLGHAKVSITLDTYSDVDPDMQVIAAARGAALVTGNAE